MARRSTARRAGCIIIMNTVFIRISDTKDKHEWGFYVPTGCVPMIGDRVCLEYALRDEEPEDCIYARISRREWGLNDEENMEVRLTGVFDEQLPDGCVAHCNAWPSCEWTKRKNECEVELERIRTQS